MRTWRLLAYFHLILKKIWDRSQSTSELKRKKWQEWGKEKMREENKLKSEITIVYHTTICHKVKYHCKGWAAHLTKLPCKERNTIGYKSHDDYVIQVNHLVKGNTALPRTETWEKIITYFYMGPSDNEDDENDSSLNYSFKNMIVNFMLHAPYHNFFFKEEGKITAAIFTAPPLGQAYSKHFICLNSQNSHNSLVKLSTIITPTLQMRKLRHQEVK